MNEADRLAERFEEQRARLRGVAYRMLGSLAEADDAVQNAWLRLSRADTAGVGNLTGWLTTVVARECLNMLRSRRGRGETPLPDVAVEGRDPEAEALLSDSVGSALLVVLDTLAPAERLAFVLHDVFAVPFDEIADILERSPDAARQLASRARRRVRGAGEPARADAARRRQVVDAFLRAVRDGDFDALLAVLDPEVVFREDGDVPLLRGRRAVAGHALTFTRHAGFARPAQVDGDAGLAFVARGRLVGALAFAFANGRIVEVDRISAPDRLRRVSRPAPSRARAEGDGWSGA